MTTQLKPARQSPRFDLLRLPLIGRLLRWRWGRLALQTPFVIMAVLLVIDGFTGPQNAARNLATVAPWVHYRGIIVIVLLMAGNLFCMACPFTVPRTLAKRLSLRGRRFPRRLRNKWVAIGSLFTLFLVYEWVDLWASPLLTAWLIVTYFVASFVLEAVFTESAFCKYVCPLGTFNFAYATTAPTQIMAKDLSVCQACVGRECLNGSYSPEPIIRIDQIGETQKEVVHGPQGTLGCGTLLFAPQISSNLDCTLCLDCARACPHDNVGWMLRAAGSELSKPEAWRKTWDVSLLPIILAFIGVSNAFGMVPPVYALQTWLAQTFAIRSELMILLIIFGVFNLGLPIGLSITAAWLTRTFLKARTRIPLRQIVGNFAPAFIPVGLGIWTAHYSFHFLIGALAIIPVTQEFLGMTGEWARFGVPVDESIIGLVQGLALLLGTLWSLYLTQQIALREYRQKGFMAMLPWVVLIMGLSLAALWIFSLPMEMRGSILLG